MRSRAREAVLQYLFTLEFHKSPSFDFQQFIQDYPLLASEPDAGDEDDTGELSSNARAFAIELYDGVRANQARIDGIISANTENWSISRMALVDRNVIRIAAYEMLCRTDIPHRVAINEAINMAKKFGGERSGAFVNSVLDKIRGGIDKDAE
ncbi:MAG: transcription antitermination factor NusB [Candidatus Brocadiia bacterium]